MKSIVALLLILAMAFAQAQTLEALETVQREEVAQIRGISLNGFTHQPELDVYLLCFGAGSGREYGYVDTNNDGYADVLRVFGADMVSAEEWRQLGPRLLGPLRNGATLRAQAQIAVSLGVHVAAENGLLQGQSSTNIAGAESASIEVIRSESIQAQTNQMLRGSLVNGIRIVSLPNNEGVCVVVRYDAPLIQNNMQTPRTLPPASSGSSSPSGPGPYTVPNPGVAGEF